MAWVELFSLFLVSHLVGDYLLQTDWQALNKHDGLGGDPTKRRALVTHVTTYTLGFVPALVWLAGDLGAGSIALVALGIFVPHLVQDDARLLLRYVRAVKGGEFTPGHPVFLGVDQTFHLLTLLLLAFAAGS